MTTQSKNSTPKYLLTNSKAHDSTSRRPCISPQKIRWLLSALSVFVFLGLMFHTAGEIDASGGSEGSKNESRADDAAFQTAWRFHQSGTGVQASDIASDILQFFPAWIVDQLSDGEIQHLADYYSGRVQYYMPKKTPTQTGEDVADVVNHAKSLFYQILTNHNEYR